MLKEVWQIFRRGLYVEAILLGSQEGTYIRHVLFSFPHICNFKSGIDCQIIRRRLDSSLSVSEDRA